MGDWIMRKETFRTKVSKIHFILFSSAVQTRHSHTQSSQENSGRVLLSKLLDKQGQSCRNEVLSVWASKDLLRITVIYTLDPIERPSQPIDVNAHIEVDLGTVRKGVLVCCTTSYYAMVYRCEHHFKWALVHKMHVLAGKGVVFVRYKVKDAGIFSLLWVSQLRADRQASSFNVNLNLSGHSRHMQLWLYFQGVDCRVYFWATLISFRPERQKSRVFLHRICQLNFSKVRFLVFSGQIGISFKKILWTIGSSVCTFFFHDLHSDYLHQKLVNV